MGEEDDSTRRTTVYKEDNSMRRTTGELEEDDSMGELEEDDSCMSPRLGEGVAAGLYGARWYVMCM